MKATQEGGRILALAIGIPIGGMMLIVGTAGWVLIVPLVALVLVLALAAIHEFAGFPRWFWLPDYHCTTCRLRAEK